MATDTALVDLLASRPLLGYTIDATHLHNILRTLIQQGQQQTNDMSQLSRRVQALEAMQDQLRVAVQRIEQAVGSHSSVQEELRTIRTQVSEVARVVDSVTQSALPEIERRLQDSSTSVQQLDRAIAALQPAVERSVAETRQQIDGLRGQVAAVVDQHKAVQSQWQQDRSTIETRERSRAAQDRAVDDALRELVPRVERIERENVPKLTSTLVELTKRTDDNFRLVEAASRNVDADISKLRTDVANTRAELNTVDNDLNHAVTKVKDDADGKFAMLLQLMQSFERNTMLMEQHVEAAGRVLAHPRSASVSSSPYSAAPSSTMVGGGNGYLSAGGGGGASTWVPSVGMETGGTTTTTLGRDGYMATTSAGGSRRPLAF